jgi:hypothetical protein
MKDYDTLTAAGIKAQFEKLRENDQENSLNNLNMNDNYDLAYENWGELEDELIEPTIDYHKTRLAAADLANACHMIILKCDQMIKEE